MMNVELEIVVMLESPAFVFYDIYVTAGVRCKLVGNFNFCISSDLHFALTTVTASQNAK